MEASYPRRAWQLLETLHAVTYFAGECREANRAVGLRGFWMGYFAARSAPLGTVGPAVVTALFANFAPAMVARSLPDAWTYASPEAVLESRSTAAAAALRRLAPAVEEAAATALPSLERVLAALGTAGRGMAAANLAVAVPEDPVAALWQAATTLREHRGDGHVACLVSAGLDGCAIHALFAAGTGTPPEVLRDNRGWSEEDWTRATGALVERGLVEPGGGLTAAGVALRADIEARTDELAGAPYLALDAGERARLLEVLSGPATAVARSGAIPFPNPIGLPAPEA